jgi:hypothetical protein
VQVGDEERCHSRYDAAISSAPGPP